MYQFHQTWFPKKNIRKHYWPSSHVEFLNEKKMINNVKIRPRNISANLGKMENNYDKILKTITGHSIFYIHCMYCFTNQRLAYITYF
jgi:hypothetical protein